MNMIAFLAAFGGGTLGAAIGAVPSFVFAGLMAIAGSAVGMAGGSDVLIGNIAFGSFFMPCVGFAGGVAAAAFAANKKGHTDLNIITPLGGTGDASILLVGGLFGLIGFGINYLYSGVLALNTDTVALTVATSGIIVRFVFGKTGLLGKYTAQGPRVWFPKTKELAFDIVYGAAIGLMISGVASVLGFNTPAAAGLPVLGFGIGAVALTFACMGFGVPAFHHIILPAGSAAVATGSIFWGVVFGILGALIGDVAGKAFNSHCDSHIDPPAVAIFILAFIIPFLPA